MTDLDRLGKLVAVEIKTARKYEAAAKEKAGVDLRKADNHWTAAAQYLAEARKRCTKSGKSFKEFKKKWAPDLSRATLYRVIAIGSGKLSIEEQRKEWREKKREKRAAVVSQTSVVRDSSPLVRLGNGQAVKTSNLGPAAQEQLTRALDKPELREPDADVSAEARKALYAEDAPASAPTDNDLTEDALARSQRGYDEIEMAMIQWLPKMMTVHKTKLLDFLVNHPEMANVKVPKRREKAAA